MSNNNNTNLVKGKYNAISSNYLISADITFIGVYGGVYLAMDHASRLIVGHKYQSEPFTADDIIKANLLMLNARSFLPPCHIWHTDRESLFTNHQYQEAMRAQGIQVSRGAAEGFQSQVMESFNKTFKQALKRKIAEHLKQTGKRIAIKGTEAFKKRTLAFSLISLLVNEVVSEYNNTTHSKLGITPNQMEEALFLKHQNKHPEGPIIAISDDPQSAESLMLTRTGSIEASFADLYTKQVIAEYKGDWLRFFLDWRNQQHAESQKILDSVVQSKDILINKLEQSAEKEKQRSEALNQKYNSLYEKFLEVQKQTFFLQEAEKKRQEEEELKQIKKAKQKLATKQLLRQTISLSEFWGIIEDCIRSKNSYVQARRKVAIAILYLTGLRVSNLLLFSTGQLLDLLNKGHTEIRLIKRGAARHPIRLAYKGSQLLERFKKEITVITQNKTHNTPAFTSRDEEQKVINVDVHERELNAILIKASAKYGKHLRTHSFRASLVSDLLAQGVALQKVKEVVGHCDIGSTLRYNRSHLTVKDIDKIISVRYK